MNEANEWACVCRYGGVGDNLIVSAILPALKKKYGRLEVITQEPQGSVFVNNPFIDKLTVRKAGDLPGDFLEWIKWHDLRAGEYRFFANLSHSVEALCAFLPAQLWSRWPVEWRRRFAGAKSYVEAVADVCGIDERDWPACKPRFYATDEENLQAVETFEKQIGPGAKGATKYVGWVVSGSRVDKIYPPSTFAVARLVRDLGDLNVHVILLGAPGRDFEMAKRIVDHVKIQNGTTERLHSMIDSDEANQRFPIRRILTQLQHCHVAIGPDTGPMWAVASESAVAKIMLLSHASERNITWNWENCVTLHADAEKVPCWPCHRLHDTLATCVPDATGQAAACISSIDVNSIVDECRRALNEADEADKDQRALDPSKGNENERGRIERDFGIIQGGGEGCGGDTTAQSAA